MYLRLASCCLLGTLSLSLTAVAQETAGKRVALLVGVNTYDKRGFNDLAYAERDVQELAVDLGKAGYEVHLLTGTAKGEKRATLRNIQAAMEVVFKGRTKADLVLVALAGHGLQIEVANDQDKLQAESFFCPADAEQGDAKTMLAMGTLFAEIDRRGGGRNLVLVDACREDPTRGRGMDGRTVKTLPEGVAVLFGCAASQKTYETEKAGGGHGVFFHTVLEGLRGGAEKNDAGEVTWGSLVEYVGDRVETNVERFIGKTSLPQTPNLVTNVRGRSPVILPRSDIKFVGLKAGQEWNGNDLKMKLCWCPSGRFTMGSPKDEKVRFDDEDQVSVTISRGFWLGKYELTQAQWKRVMDSEPWSSEDFVKKGDDYPVTHVSWGDATRFCEELTRRERAAGRLPANWAYRLPTEAQWEYACRAGGTKRFHFGDDESDLGSYAWYAKNTADVGEKYAHTVGGKRANDWGLHDIHGNVQEWCRDYYRTALPGGTDPEQTEAEFESGNKVLRGGGWRSVPWQCLSANRSLSAWSHGPNAGLGFRVALVQTSK